jgi:predicted KAP-like P-loop ATPase
MAETETNLEVKSEDFNEISADKGLVDPTQDRLGYAPFAKHLAESICKLNAPEGFVIAVYGSWGSGKSTLLNFLVHYLKEKPESEQPIIVPFNPWLFSGEKDITKRFFDQLQTILTQLKYVPKGFTDRIADLGKFVSAIPLPYAQTGTAVANLFDNKQKATSDLKEEVQTNLEKEDRRIVLTIDDIDRLGTDDIKQLFHIIKAIPNFTNIIYFLVLDKEVLIKTFAETEGIPAETYLKRLVQVAFQLPIPDKTLLRRLLFEKLDAVIVDTPKHLFDKTYWGNVYFQGIDHFIANTRDIVRLLDKLSVTYPVVKGEVNLVDFIAIESLQVFSPIVYDIIRKNPKNFVENVDNKGFLNLKLEELKNFHNSWLAQVQNKDREPVKRLLLRLFPHLEAIWGNGFYPGHQEAKWRKQLRVCNLEIFPRYFRLALPVDELSDNEIKASFILAENATAFGENLLELANQKCADGTTQVRAFLERLEDYTEKEIPSSCIPSIVQALLDVGDRLLRPEDEPCGMFDFGNDLRIRRIIGQLLRRLDEAARFEVLKEAMSKGNAVSTIVDEVAALAQEYYELADSQTNPDEETLINTQHLKELEAIALQKIQYAAKENFLLQAPNLPQTLSCWQSWGGKEAVQQWAEKVIDNDEGLVEFLENFLGEKFSKSRDDVVSKIDLLELYLDLSLVIGRVRSLDETTELTEVQKSAIAQFIEEYDMSHQSKEPEQA